MARVAENILPDNVDLALTLDRYQEIMRLPINAFNGVNKPTEIPAFECSTIWTQSDRDNLAMYLSDAEEMREQELGYHLAPKYLEGEEHPYVYGGPVILKRKHVISIGKKATSVIQAGVVLDHGIETSPNDPVTISIATSISTSEIVVRYPGESVKIRSSSVSATGGVVTIKIPRARLVKPELNDNREDHLDYYDNDNFLATVDIYREYVDESLGAFLVWSSPQRVIAGVQTYPDSSETTQRANVQILGNDAKRIGKLYLYPATTGGAASTFTYCLYPAYARVSYLSGRQASMKTELETARLSHILMPNVPCSCPYVQQYWAEDRLEDPSGLVTPYGNQVGAVRAWLSDSRAKVGQGGKFPRLWGG